MGYVIVVGSCFGCSRPFSFNPLRVPSISIQGDRKPICQDCVERVNPMRVANGLEPIMPHPEAYEPADENEI